MRFGVNYTPSKGWFHSWLDPQWDSVKADLEAIASIGLDHVRIFPFWPILQPNRTYINRKGIDDVRHMVELAAQAGLDSYVDVLQGHMSSFDFVPSWLVSWHETSMFSDPEAVEAEANLTQALYDACAQEPRFKGLTLGNECNQFADKSHPRRMKATSDDIDSWLTSLAAPVKQAAAQSGRILLHSENDAIWYVDGHPFLPRQAANEGDVTAIHSWVFNGTAQHYGPLSDESTRHAEYLVELSKAFSADPHRQVWLQEIGAPGNVIEPADAPAFCRQSVDHVLDTQNLYGVTWWCSHDVDSSLADFPPFEHDLGLFDESGALKPIGKEFSRLAREHEARPAAGPRTTAIVVPVDSAGTPLMRAASSPGGSLFDAWMERAKNGERPAFVTSADAENATVLAARGITDCVSVELRAGTAYNVVSDPSLEDAVAE
jgi:endo-1,4-beta-mannosidase